METRIIKAFKRGGEVFFSKDSLILTLYQMKEGADQVDIPGIETIIKGFEEGSFV